MLKEYRYPVLEKVIAFMCKQALELPKNRYTHIYLQGSTGCGKSESTKQAIYTFFGRNAMENRSFYKVGDKLVGFLHAHGGSMEVDYAIPTLTTITPEIRKRELGDNAKGIVEGRMGSGDKALDCVLERFYQESITNGADMLVILIDDANKHRAVRFNNFLKSLLESRILYTSLPKTFMVMTGNPADGIYDASAFDATVQTSLFQYAVKVQMEDSLQYVIKDLPMARGFFESNPDMFHQEPKDRSTEPFPNIRSWTNCLTLIKAAGFEDLELVEAILNGGVGMKATMAFMTWLKTQNMKPPLTLEYLLKEKKDFLERLKAGENFDGAKFAEDLLARPDMGVWREAYKAFKDFPDAKLAAVICVMSAKGNGVSVEDDVFVKMDNLFQKSTKKDRELALFVFDKLVLFRDGKKEEEETTQAETSV